MIVVSDEPDRLITWIPVGTVRQVPTTPPTRPHPVDPADPTNRKASVIANLELGDWVLTDHVWDVSTLWIMRPGDWHAAWASWRADGTKLGWYINLQEPFVRTEAGIDAMDLMLDIVAEPDCSSWRWKDADEFDELVDRGIFGQDLAGTVLNEAHRVIESIEARTGMFGEPWHDWRPDPSWPRPRLRDGQAGTVATS